ncbi:hypothetical protein [Natrarchaeobaculum aegyptiacum]|uniref:DUF3267 domain-containing protein n=1 Tax=Natrarchaeobaculum aegyptiacum TaxID=745377 RepID=A0A2Z2HY18_9EURY|nr:hypothetical protein [Natrarchaeobaculum aegyptiacum]ARS89914.1 hypothetical protein B1756_09360 [Natrarchaeobaculum aegyptiacum]
MIRRFVRFVCLLGTLLLVPAIVAHEATHYVFAKPVAEDVRLEVWPVPAVAVVWCADAPRWRCRLAKLAPTTVGVTMAPLVGSWLVLETSVHWTVAVLLVGYWTVYTIPSAGDLTVPE